MRMRGGFLHPGLFRIFGVCHWSVVRTRARTVVKITGTENATRSFVFPNPSTQTIRNESTVPESE
jgi:hypothetical protein